MPATDVFVFRHCVRSTSTTIKSAADGHTHAADYSAVPLPQWGVPENWCTPGGLSILRNSAAQLLQDAELTNPKLVADTVMRDHDSAVAFMRGLGLAQASVQLAPGLFDPEDPDIGPVPPCAAAANYTDAEVHAQVSERLASLPRPGSLADDLALAESLVGAGAAPLTSLAEPSVLPTGKLAGAPNALKRVAQQIVYAFASGVPYPLLNGRNATADEMHRLLAWQHWARAVKDVHVGKAVENAMLLRSVLDELDGTAPPTTSSGNGVGVGNATRGAVYFGHDGNLDGLATLLGLEWEAPPYVSMGGRLTPTPPGSALRFTRRTAADGAREEVRVSFVYPVFTAGDTPPGGGSVGAGGEGGEGGGGGGGGARRDASGALRTTPILTGLTMAQLRARAEEGLVRYPAARACFDAAAAVPLPSADDAAGAAVRSCASDEGGWVAFVVLLLLFVAVGLLVARRWWCSTECRANAKETLDQRKWRRRFY